MRVEIENIKIAEAFKRCINSTELDDIEVYENGELLEINPEFIDEFKFTGLSNIDFFTSGFYKEGWKKENE